MLCFWSSQFLYEILSPIVGAYLSDSYPDGELCFYRRGQVFCVNLTLECPANIISIRVEEDFSYEGFWAHAVAPLFTFDSE